MPKTLANLTVQKGEIKEYVSPEGVRFTIENLSMGFKKVRLAFVYGRGPKKKTEPKEQWKVPPEEDPIVEKL